MTTYTAHQWAESKIGTKMKTPRTKEEGVVVSYVEAVRGNGFWFYLDIGKRVYRKTPARCS